MSVTTLGSRSGDAVGAVAAVIDYLDGRQPERGRLVPESSLNLARISPAGGVTGYYADSVEGPGRWLGQGMMGLRLEGEVDTEVFRRVLLGQDPASGLQLVGSRSSAVRADRHRPAAGVDRRGPAEELLTLAQAAGLTGVSARYLRRVAVRTQSYRQEMLRCHSEGTPLPVAPRVTLDASHSAGGGHWRVTRGELRHYMAERRAPVAVVGYDLTFSVPKSVSILWAGAEAWRRAEIVAAVNAAVDVGMAYLEEQAVRVQGPAGVGDDAQRAHGLVAASFLHATSRALDPQLHCHVVVANMAQRRSDGATRALDGRPLYVHARTAGYLAAAELRVQLTRRLGLAWNPVERGIADVAGVSEAAIETMSRRSAEIDELTDTLGVASAGARQSAAYATRPAKDHAVDPVALRAGWKERLEAVGFDPSSALDCYDRQAAPALVTAEDRDALSIEMASHRGLTEKASTFDRRDVIQFVAEWAGDRLSASEICDVADAWLACHRVVRLNLHRPFPNVGDANLRPGHLRALTNEGLFTTPEMLEVEERIFVSYGTGTNVGAGLVPSPIQEAALAQRPGLAAEQAEMVRNVTGSGHRFQCVIGPAGSGKTTALEAAVRAWEEAGFRPIGTAVQGTAAELLGLRTGMASRTVAALLVDLDTGRGHLDSHTVVIVDEASTLGNRDMARLMSHVEAAGAVLRLVGDPAQHSSVAAGGAWRALVERFPDDAASLAVPRRQQGDDMEPVRLALAEYREGKVADALERLHADRRVVEAASPDELLDALVTDWHVDRQRRVADPSLAPSSMVAEHHTERKELNRRARVLLAADGQINGPELAVGAMVFQAGDEVIARAPAPGLRPEGGREGVRNGMRGTVVDVLLPTEVDPGSLVVDFERRGRVVVPRSYLERRIRPGIVGGLAHSYALTSFAAQGETYEAARHLGSDRSSRAGIYVGLSRGRSDVRLYLLGRRDIGADTHLEMPSLRTETTAMEAVVARVASEQSERLATELDANARHVAALQARQGMRAVESPGSSWRLARQAPLSQLGSVTTMALLNPEPAIVARLGPRAAAGPSRELWDEAVGALAIYRARWGGQPIPGGTDIRWALGPEPAGPAMSDHRQASAALRRAEIDWTARQAVIDLSTEQRELERVLLSGPDQVEIDRAQVVLADAHERLVSAQVAMQSAASRHDELTSAPRWRQNAQGVELARRQVSLASHALAAAQLNHQRYDERVRALEEQTRSLGPVRDRLAVVDTALDRQVEVAAVDKPSAYLSDALGDRPHEGLEREGWDDAARDIERYRHVELGLSPQDGPLGPGPLGAIGTRPDDFLAATAWDRAAATTLRGQGLVMHQPAPDIGIDL